MPDVKRVIKGLICRLECDCMDEGRCNSECPYLEDPRACYGLDEDALVLLKAQEPPTSESISSAIECLLHPQDADDSDMAKAIDTAVRAMRLLKAQEPRVMADAELTDAELIEEIRKAPLVLKPAVDAAPVVHGYWVKMTGMMPPEYHGHYECSECKWHMKGLRNSWTREEELYYCPNCGAKMDK